VRAQRTRHGRHRIRGKRGAPQSACYGHATGGLSAYYPGRISTVTAIFPARIFKILCGFFRPEFSYIFFRPGERLQVKIASPMAMPSYTRPPWLLSATTMCEAGNVSLAN
jgi:hypothetical protein